MCTIHPCSWADISVAPGPGSLPLPPGPAHYRAFTTPNSTFWTPAPWRAGLQRAIPSVGLPSPSHPRYWLFHIWSWRQQPLYLPPSTGVWRRRADADVSSFWQRYQLQGVHRPSNQSEQMFRLCQFWQSNFCTGCNPGYERFPNRDEKAESPAEEAKGCQPSLLKNESRWSQQTFCSTEKLNSLWTKYYFCISQKVRQWTEVYSTDILYMNRFNFI